MAVLKVQLPRSAVCSEVPRTGVDSDMRCRLPCAVGYNSCICRDVGRRVQSLPVRGIARTSVGAGRWGGCLRNACT